MGMSRCPDCGLDLDHCHGTLVIHGDRTTECTNPACELPDLLRHAFVIDCLAVSGGCCAEGGPWVLAAAS
jgi:hypothetical protein